MVVSRNNECPQIIFINGNKLKQKGQFKCSGTLISRDETDIRINTDNIFVISILIFYNIL